MQALAASSVSAFSNSPASQTVILVFSSRYGMLNSYHCQHGTLGDPQPVPYLDLLAPELCTGEWSIRCFEGKDIYCILRGIARAPAADLRTAVLLSSSEMTDFYVKNGSPEEWHQRLAQGWRPGQKASVVAIAPSSENQLRTGTDGD